MSLESAAGGGGDTNRKAVSVGTEGGLYCWTEGSRGVTGEKVREQDKITPQGLEDAQILHLVKWASQVVLVVKNLPASAGDRRDVGSIPETRRSPGGGHDHQL